MSKFADQVVFITGAGRGQGRSHAVRFAEEGAAIIATDLCGPVDAADYPMSSRDDLDETVRAVEAVGGRIIAQQADVRSQEQLDAAVAAGVDAFGRIDIVLANAGIFTGAETTWDMTEEQWTTTLDIDLGGVWRTCKATIPTLIAGGNGGSILMTSSSNGFRAEAGHPAYNAAKLGMVALMRALAGELGPHNIRVNTVHPTTVKTGMMWNDNMIGAFMPGESTKTIDPDVWWKGLEMMNILPVGAIEPGDVSALLMFLASNEGRYITGTEVPVDAGYIIRN
ncbi:mycofactocin-coupled SDR family oxidoreductase [Gordonia sp. SID5947]|uniref:mycofactocin-coupled SDR family oxidoreductase n=1 Tax=Gordonia sp. SID5947 TaxID=2690315 RepID=UPI0013686305|nr:mycofactocin-coupled SDR family oxidoreductase [Gordonia sp. SID5947]MYR07944.1 mycofactocin-coupled SDR family oxidoreductase [Gordonia sp. SID5947]